MQKKQSNGYKNNQKAVLFDTSITFNNTKAPLFYKSRNSSFKFKIYNMKKILLQFFYLQCLHQSTLLHNLLLQNRLTSVAVEKTGFSKYLTQKMEELLWAGLLTQTFRLVNQKIAVVSPDYWIVKLNKAGRIEWDKTYGGSSEDDFAAMEPTADGGYILGGTSFSNESFEKSENSKGLDDYWIVKVDSLR